MIGKLTAEIVKNAGNKTEEEIKKLCDQIRQVSYGIHVYHGHGHLEKVMKMHFAIDLENAE